MSTIQKVWIGFLLLATSCGLEKMRVSMPPVDEIIDLGAGFRDLTAELLQDPVTALLGTFPRIRRPGEPCGPPTCMEGPEDTTCVFGPTGSGLVLMSTAQGPMLFKADLEMGKLVRQDIDLRRGEAPMAWQDIDGDGMPDRVFAKQGFTIRWGNGASDTDISSSLQITGLHVTDLNNDGYRDIVVAGYCQDGTASGSISVFFQGPARVFTERQVVVGNWCHSGYAVWVGVIGNDRFIFAATGGGSHQSDQVSLYRETRRDHDGFPVYEPYEHEPAVGYYGPTVTPEDAHNVIEEGCLTGQVPPEWCYSTRSATESLRLLQQEMSKERYSFADRAVMGYAVGDITGDGLDEVVATLNTDHFTMSRRLDDVFLDITQQTGFPVDPFYGDHHLQIPWAAAFLPIARTGYKDAIFTYGKDGSAWIDGGDDHQKTRLFINKGSASFVEATSQAGLLFTGQWKSLAVGDLFGRGVPDLCVGGQSELPRLLVNQIDNGKQGLSLRLIERSGIVSTDARVEVEVAGLPRQYLRPDGIGSPWVFSEPLIFVGLGTAKKADIISIRWSSGNLQELRDTKAGMLHVVHEP